MKSIWIIILGILVTVEAQVMLPHRRGVVTLASRDSTFTNNYGGYIGEHPIINNGKLYTALWSYYNPTNTTNGGVAVQNPTTGEMLKQINGIPSAYTDVAVWVDGNGKIHEYAADGGLYRLNETSGAIEQSVTVPSGLEWEAVISPDGTNILVPANPTGIRVVAASDYTVSIWTNSSPKMTNGALFAAPTPLVVSNYIYIVDYAAKLWKLNVSDGTTANSLQPSAQTLNNYASPTYDATHNVIYWSDGPGQHINCTDLGALTNKWQTTMLYEPYRNPVYYNGYLYVEARTRSGNNPSAIWQLNSTNGALVWAHEYAYANDLQIGSIVGDDSYIYYTTYDAAATNLIYCIALEQATGNIKSMVKLAGNASSGIPQAWHGYLFCPLWADNGLQKIQMRSGGGGYDMPWRNTNYHTTWAGPNLSGSLVTTTNFANTLTNNLTAYWRFDEASGNATDVVASYVATNINTATFGTGYITNCAIMASASSQYFRGPNITDFSGDATVTFWFYLSSIPNTAMALVAKSEGATADWEIYHNSLHNLSFYSGSAPSFGIGASLVSGKWYFAAFRHSTAGGGNHYLTLWIDGVMWTGTLGGTITNSSANLEFGASQESFDHLDGKLDEVAFYSRVLTTQELWRIYQMGMGRTYPFQ